MRVIYEDGHKVPIKLWPNEVEQSAMDQINNVAKLPFLFHHLAFMPDCHAGFGCPIGSVVACTNAVLPSLVGVDIGCGMLACKTSLTELSIPRLKQIMGLIRKRVPVGFSHHSEKQDEKLMPLYANYVLQSVEYPVIYREYNSALKQLGTLGGGNHFIEIQKGSDGHIWFMIHSGSRNLGLKVAKYHNDIAKELNAKWYTSIDPKHELAFLPADTEEAKTYLKEMQYCLEFAYANRMLMAERIKQSFNDVPCEVCNGQGGVSGTKCPLCKGTGLDPYRQPLILADFIETINIHHNYAKLEHHFGHNVWVHRKGATSATEGELGIIPGSQGTSSYIVRGKGNPESFMSCSHGAGRKMGRKEACRSLNLEEEKKMLDEKGIVHSIRNQNDLEEAAGAYKNVEIVMEEQKHLVDIVVKLEPMGVIKG